MGSGEAAAKASEDEMSPVRGRCRGKPSFYGSGGGVGQRTGLAAFGKKKGKMGMTGFWCSGADSLPADAGR